MVNQNDVPTPELRLELFGGPRLYRGESTVPLSPQEALLVGLLGAFGPEGAMRPDFFEFLWSSGSSNAVKLRFGQLLHMLRAKLHCEDAVIQVDGRLLLNRYRIASDLEEWEDALSVEDLPTALNILERGFFSGMRGSQSHALGDWVLRRKANFKSRLHEAIGIALSSAESRADFAYLAILGRLQLRMEPDDEEALYRAMRAHVLIDELPAAAAAFRSFSARRKQLDPDWEPDSDTTELLRSPSRLGSRPNLPCRGLIGRAAEIRELTAIARGSGPECSRVVLLQGPHGRGKSSLLRALLPIWQLKGHPILEAFCGSDEADVSLGVFHQLVGDTPLPWGGSPYGTLSCNAPPSEAFRYLSALLREIACPHHLTLLVIDDIDLADDASLRVLEWALRSSLRRDLMLICTAGSDARARSRILPLLKADPNHHHLPLPPLPSDSAEELVASLRPGTSSRLASEVVRLAGGNPLFIGRLCRDPSISEGPLEVLSQPLSDLLVSCIRDGPRWTAQILAALSVRGVAWTVDSLSRCLRVDLEPLHKSLRYLLDIGSVAAEGQTFHISVLAFELVVRHSDSFGLPSTRRRIAVFLTDEAYPAEVLVQAWGNANDPHQAMSHSALAAAAAGIRGDVHSRVEFLRYGLRYANGTERSFEFQVLLGTALFLARQVQEAIPLLEEACEEAFRRGSRETWLQLRLRLIDAGGHLDGAAPQATVAKLEKHMETCTQANAFLEGARALDRILHYHHRAGDENGVSKAFTTAETLLHFAATDEVRARTHATLAMRTYYGDPLGGLTHARQAVRFSENSEDRSLRLHTLNRLLAVLIATGRLRCPSEKAAIAEALDLTGSDGDLLQRSHVLINLAVWEADCGNWETASEKLRQLIPIVGSAQDKRPLVLALCNLGLVLVRSGQLTDAGQVLEEGRRLLQHWESQEVRAQFHAGLGWLALESGRIGLAGDHFAELSVLASPKSADLTTITLFRCHYLRRKGLMDKAFELFASTIRDTQPRFPVHAVALICARARFRGRHPTHDRWRLDREWALSQAQKLHLSEWAAQL